MLKMLKKTLYDNFTAMSRFFNDFCNKYHPTINQHYSHMYIIYIKFITLYRDIRDKFDIYIY